ncbi:acetylornithine deacetylase [Microbulbifer sp. S227A]|uniref:acetylornithine deacetylase n=1 Tax=Microbulbifer sp. S227A TaxID=3415131 RepID=UPI003C7B7F0A
MKNMTAEQILEQLVGHRTVVGSSNLALVAVIAEYLEGHGARVKLMTGPEGDRANLFATIGDASRPGYVLSGHTDVVPAQEPEWRDDPFVLRRDGDRLIARGACDMKGFNAAVLAAVPKLAAMPLGGPIHIALSYDEEAGCRGVPHMIARLPELCAPAVGCIVGEPTGLRPVLAHKGKAAVRLSARGVPGHSSRPDKGVNAIHALLPALTAAARQAAALEHAGRDARFQPPWSTVQIGTVEGGTAVNIIPEDAHATIEARAIAGVDPRALIAPVLEAAGDRVRAEWLSTYPALALAGDAPLAGLIQRVSGATPMQAVSFGTEAGLFQAAGIPSVICGPGDIARAHRPEEYLTRQELDATVRMILRLGVDLSS